MPYVVTSDSKGGALRIAANAAEDAMTIADVWAMQGQIHIMIETPEGDILPLLQFRALVQGEKSSPHA